MNSKILILHDLVDKNSQLDQIDTLEQVSQIESSLHRLGYECEKKAFNGDFLSLKKEKGRVIFNLVETYYGSKFLHIIPLYAKLFGCKVTGGDSQSLFLSGDKKLAKEIMSLAHIPTPPWLSSNRELWEFFVGKTLICKPTDQEGSVGISDASVITCSSMEEVEKLYSDENLLVELFVEGREFNVSLLSVEGQLQILPIAEMVYSNYPKGKPKIVGYEAKWEPGSFEYNNTNRSFNTLKEESLLEQQIETVARNCWSLFGKAGFARIDLRVDKEKKVWVLEMNVNPSLSEDSGFIAACAVAGYSYDQVIELIVREALCERVHI